MSTAVDCSVSSGCHVSSRTARRKRSVAARVSRGPSISMRMPVSIGSVSSRPAATATCATADASSSAGDGARQLRHRGQLRVVLDRHGGQAEPAAAAVDRGAGPVDDEVDRLGGQRAGDVGQQPAGDEHAAGIADGGLDLDAGRGLVVEPGDGEPLAGRARWMLRRGRRPEPGQGDAPEGCARPMRPHRPGRRVRPGTSWRGPLASWCRADLLTTGRQFCRSVRGRTGRGITVEPRGGGCHGGAESARSGGSLHTPLSLLSSCGRDIQQ